MLDQLMHYTQFSQFMLLYQKKRLLILYFRLKFIQKIQIIQKELYKSMISQYYDQEDIEQILNDIDFGKNRNVSTGAFIQHPEQIKLLDDILMSEKGEFEYGNEDDIFCCEPLVYDQEQLQDLPIRFEKDDELQFEEPTLQRIETKDKANRQTQNLEQLVKSIGEQEENISNEQDLKRLLFKQKIIRNKNQKNANFPKFLLRLLQTEFEKVGIQFKEEWNQMDYINRKIKKLKYRNCHKNIGVLSEMLKNDERMQDLVQKKIARKIMNRILRKRSIESVIKNNHVHSKKTYLVAAKVYALRCMSSSLTDRIQSI